LKLPMPRIRDFGILPGFVTLWDILSNKFHVTNNDAMRYISTVFGFAAGVLMLLVGYLVWHRTQLKSVGFASFFASTILLLSLFFSPVLHGSAGTKDCSSNVILSNEQIGSYLRGIIPVGSLVYWFGGLSAAPLLYLPEVNIFPAQINDGYSFISHGNTAELFKFGLWNEEMDANWKATADYFIIEDNRYNGWKEFFNPQQFDEFARSPVRTSCNEGSSLLVFRRK